MGKVFLSQYMRPHGDRKEVSVDLSDEVSAMAGCMRLSCEVLQGGNVVLYARKLAWDEEQECMGTAENGPGERSPKAVLEELIRRVYIMTEPPLVAEYI